MSTKAWNQFTTRIEKLLSDHVKSTAKTSEIMKDVQSQRKDLIKLMTNATSGKTKKDPNAPKKGRSKYIFFCKANRDEVKNKNPNMSNLDITKELGLLWKKLSEDKKKPYEKLAEQDKLRFQQEKETYVPPPHLEDVKSKKKVNTGPKKAKTAYICFSKVERVKVKDEFPDMSAQDIMRTVGVRWKKLTEEEKEPYQKMALEDKERFNAELVESGGEVPKPKADTKKTATKAAPKKVVKKKAAVVREEDKEEDKEDSDDPEDDLEDEDDEPPKKVVTKKPAKPTTLAKKKTDPKGMKTSAPLKKKK